MKRGPGSGHGYNDGNYGGGGGGHHGGHGGQQPNSKRARSGGPGGEKFECRILVPSKFAGSIIGKGGSNIQKLRADNNANVRIPDCPGPERIMSVMASDHQSVVKVLKQSLPYLADPDRNSDEVPMEMRLLIHQSVVGGIIGRAGFKIKEIREKSGSNIKVYQNCAPQSTDRCVSIQGNPDTISAALTEIFDVVINTDVKGSEEPYDPINFDAYYASEYGGFGSEMDLGFASGGGGPSSLGGGRGMGRGGPSSGSRGPGGPRGGLPFRGGGRDFGNRFDGADDFGYGGRDSHSFQGPRGGGGGRFNNRGGRNFGNGGGFAPPAAAEVGSFDQGGFRGHPDSSGPQENVQVTIPKDMAGAIIGPGGSRIRKIRNDSRATITIDEPGAGSTERIITIVGTQDQIQTAQYLLQQSVRENAPHLAAGGNGGGGGYGGGY